MGSIFMIVSTEYHTNHWNIIPRDLNDLRLYKDDCSVLHKKGFKVSAKITYEDDGNDNDNVRNYIYYDLFKNII